MLPFEKKPEHSRSYLEYKNINKESSKKNVEFWLALQGLKRSQFNNQQIQNRIQNQQQQQQQQQQQYACYFYFTLCRD